MSVHVYCGCFVHATDDKPMDVVTDYILGVKDGKILFFEPKDCLKELSKKHGVHSKNVQHMTESQFMMPGLVDVQNNAMQYPLAGTSVALPLWDVMKSRSWPLETRYEDGKFAKKVFTKVVDRNLKNGITTACYQTGIHTIAATELWDIVDKAGQRAFIGKSNRDSIRGEVGYDAYMELTQESLKSTKQFLDDVKQKSSALITPILSPSSMSTVTPDMMNGVFELMKEYGIPVQIRLGLCETDDEDAVRLHGGTCGSSIELLQNYGVLRRTVVNCVFLSDDDISLIKQNCAGIVHCPISNMSSYCGTCDVRKMIENGVKVGLGTDVGASYSSSLLESIRATVQVSKALSFQKTEDYESVTLEEAFMLATLGGSQVLGIDNKIGNFEVGKELDALLIDVNHKHSPIDVFKDVDECPPTMQDTVCKFLLLGNDRNIIQVIVGGKAIIDRHSISAHLSDIKHKLPGPLSK